MKLGCMSSFLGWKSFVRFASGGCLELFGMDQDDWWVSFICLEKSSHLRISIHWSIHDFVDIDFWRWMVYVGGDLVIADCGVCAEMSAFNDEIAKSLFQRNSFYLRKSIRYAERGWAVKKSSSSMCMMIPLSQCKWLWFCFFFSANLSGMCIYLMAGVGLVLLFWW